MSDDAEALARQLQEAVLTPLAAVAARLDSVMALAAEPQVQRRVAEVAEELARIAGTLRAQLRDLQRGDDAGAVASLRELVLDAGQRIGCAPRFEVEATVADLDPELLDEVRAVLHEALENVVRHAYAGTIEVSVSVDDRRLTVVVVDDGVGPNDEPSGGTGIADMTARAETRGGSFSIEPNEPLGTRVTWSVPL